MNIAERVALRFQHGPLAVPGVKSYDLQGGPPGFTLDLDVPEPQNALGVVRGEVGVWVRNTSEDALEKQGEALLGLVSKFTRSKAAWTGDWHQNGDLWLRGVSFG